MMQLLGGCGHCNQPAVTRVQRQAQNQGGTQTVKVCAVCLPRFLKWGWTEVRT